MIAFFAVIVGILAGICTTFLTSLISGTLLWILWGYIGSKYFLFLPALYLHISWWDMIVISWLLMLIGNLLSRDINSASASKS